MVTCGTNTSRLANPISCRHLVSPHRCFILCCSLAQRPDSIAVCPRLRGILCRISIRLIDPLPDPVSVYTAFGGIVFRMPAAPCADARHASWLGFYVLSRRIRRILQIVPLFRLWSSVVCHPGLSGGPMAISGNLNERTQWVGLFFPI